MFMPVKLLAIRPFAPVSYQVYQVRMYTGRERIGDRDVVGFGVNGGYNYKDDVHFPFPAIRFKENTADIKACKAKEKGEWRLMCCEEKKALYRHSYCQTFAEFQHSTGLWKLVAGGVLFMTSFGFWAVMFFHFYVSEPLPISLSMMSQSAQLRRMIDLHVNPIDGLTSEWDYIGDRWKFQTEELEKQKYLKKLSMS